MTIYNPFDTFINAQGNLERRPFPGNVIPSSMLDPIALRAAAKEVDLKVPLVVRLEGTNVEQGKAILAQSGLAIVPANDLGDAARKIVAEVRKAA